MFLSVYKTADYKKIVGAQKSSYKKEILLGFPEGIAIEYLKRMS
jgi:hypothetical protein